MNTYLLKLPLKTHNIFLDNPHLSGVKYLLAVTSESWQQATQEQFACDAKTHFESSAEIIVRGQEVTGLRE